jgi:hypothetical protein
MLLSIWHTNLWGDNIKMDIKVMRYEIDWIHLAEDRDM